MANLEALFDHEVDKKKIEEKARNEYFHKVHAQTHKFVDDLVEQLQFLNKKGFKVYKQETYDTTFYIDYPTNQYTDGVHIVRSRVCPFHKDYECIGETRRYPSMETKFLVDWHCDMCHNTKDSRYLSLEELIQAYTLKLK